MILCDPFAINTVCISVVKQLQRLVNAELLPRVSFFCLKSVVCFLQFIQVISLVSHYQLMLHPLHYFPVIFRCKFSSACVKLGSECLGDD